MIIIIIIIKLRLFHRNCEQASFSLFQIRFAEVLLKAGADPDIQREWCGTPILHHSIRSAEPKVFDLLLRHGADPRKTDCDGKTALHYSANWGQTNIAKRLLAAGLDPNEFDDLESTPLSGALLLCKNVETVELFMRHTDISLRSPERGATAAHSIHYGHDPQAAYYLTRLLKLGVDKEAVCYCSGTVLHETARIFDYECLQMCIDAGCNLNAENQKGETALIQLLSDTDTMCYNFPIRYAKGRTGSVEMLINAGADVDIPDPQGRTPLEWAVLKKNPTGVRQLLQANCRVNIWKDSIVASGFMAAAVSSGDKDCATFIFGDSCSTADQQFFYDLSHTPSAMVEGESIGLSKPPLPLSSLSRLVVRASLPRKGPAFLKDVDQLPFPRRLRNFVALRLSPSDQFKN